MYKLYNWAVHAEEGNPYYPPEDFPKYLSGECPGHPKFINPNKRLVTSSIQEVNGRVVKTNSGTLYELTGPPSDDYLKWMTDNNRAYDPEQPIKTRKI